VGVAAAECERDVVEAGPPRHLLVLAGRTGVFHDGSGPAFPILVRTDGPRTERYAVGSYAEAGKRRFGRVPDEALDEPVILRLEITRAQFERAAAILATWERRAREGVLLYSKRSNLDNVVLAKTVVESLNRCGPRVELYPLNWLRDEDALTEAHPPKDVPFEYFKELRKRNERLHLAEPRSAAEAR
jgi:hypothetical protein